MIAPLEGAEGAIGVVVYGNQGKGGHLRYAPRVAVGVRWRITRFGLRSGVIGIRQTATWMRTGLRFYTDQKKGFLIRVNPRESVGPVLDARGPTPAVRYNE